MAKDAKKPDKNDPKADRKISAGSIGFPSNRRTPSMESTKSELGIGEQTVLTPEGGAPPESYGTYLYDCCAFVIFCPKHNQIAMSKGKGKGLWLPFVSLKPTDTWQNAAIGGASFILSHGDLQTFAQMNQVPFTNPEPINILRIQLPQVLSFVSRITYAVRIAKDTQWQCCQNDKRIQWFPAEDVMQGNVERLWGPEPYLYGEEAMKSSVTNREIVEFSLDDAMMYVPHETPRNKEEEMLKSAIFTEKDISKLYSDFIQHCFPSHFMSYPSFVDYMSKIGWSSTDIRLHSIFRAFNYRSTGFLSFHELLLGLGAIDQATQHGGHPGELRCGYIFRYYDVNNDGYLDYNDIYRMTCDIFKGKEVDADESMVERETKHRMLAMGLKQNDLLAFSVFLHAVGALTFRGTSVLFRSSIATIQQIMLKSCYESIQNFAAGPAGVARRKYKGICPACRSKKYKIALHGVRLDFIGKIIEPKSLLDTEGKDVNFTTEDQLTEQLRTYSRETVFNPLSGANSVLDTLRQFDSTFFKKGHSYNRSSAGASLDKDKLRDWMSQDRNVLLNTITALCRQAEEIFSMEQRCIKVNSPCFVLGDIHGNFSDLMVYERTLWRTGPAVCPSSFLFLGDYVDRGEYGVECVAYLFACKILAPDKYFLVRGNHEIRSIQRMFTFHKECVNKYGARIGPQIWEVINKVFDRMPVCAVIDENIFCAHGGIPTSVTKIEDLQKIPNPLCEPEGESPPAWEIMWNDPMNPNEFADLAEFMKIKTDNVHGFLTNTKRGTAFYFTEEAINNFLNANGLTSIIRGHEVMPLGYKFHMGGKVITVFSCSNYCGGTNEAACIYVDQDRLRVIRIDTAS